MGVALMLPEVWESSPQCWVAPATSEVLASAGAFTYNLRKNESFDFPYRN